MVESYFRAAGVKEEWWAVGAQGKAGSSAKLCSKNRQAHAAQAWAAQTNEERSCFLNSSALLAQQFPIVSTTLSPLTDR